MKTIYNWLISPLSLPINPIYEYAILSVIELIAHILAFRRAGRVGTMPQDRREWYLLLKIVFTIAVWAIVRGIIWLVRNPKWALIIGCSIIGILIITLGISYFNQRRKNDIAVDEEE